MVLMCKMGGKKKPARGWFFKELGTKERIDCAGGRDHKAKRVNAIGVGRDDTRATTFHTLSPSARRRLFDPKPGSALKPAIQILS